ncbi:GIY-YIG nuclease family protein [[Mycoplasma] imitans]|uniref:GIY-YIG nuclease family protein n=1 Tax=[Mycoplasma] imitans TaxID=29560 RepID=UPI00047FF68C|nr:GIY-YIG nuclease family protein [[Mycoplasma] imitans]
MEQGVIYILTNPSFPDYVKIGYADDVTKRLKELNRSECIPFAFRLYAYYKVQKRLTDMKLHQMIDKLNPNLRSIEEFDGKTRKREFYNMSASDGYSILETIAQINGLEGNLVLVEPTTAEVEDEKKAEEIRTRAKLPRLDWIIQQGIINVGDKICVISHPEKVGTIVDGKHVKYDGKIMTLNVYGCEITGWPAGQGYAFIRPVNSNKTLSVLREEKMRELGMIK